MLKKIKNYGLLALMATGLVTYSGTIVTLESADLTTLGSAVWGFAETALNNFVKILPYMALMVVVFFLIKKIPAWLKLGGGGRGKRR